MLVHNFLEYYASNLAEQPCLTIGDEVYSYGDVNKKTNQVANGLLRQGILPEQRIAVLGENSAEHLLVFMAAGKIGAVTVSLNYRLALEELAYVISDSKSHLLFVTDREFEKLSEQLKILLKDNLKIISTIKGTESLWNDWLLNQPGSIPKSVVEETSPFFQLYTSGTTGHPKGVVLSHKNLVSLCTMNTLLTSHRNTLGAADIICAPLFHIGGAGSLIISIFCGSHIVLHKNFDPASIVNDIEEYSVNSIFLVPAMIMAILALPDIEEKDFSRLNQIYYGASPISETVLNRAISVFNVDFVQMYGMTETSGSVVSLSAQDHKRALENAPELLKSCGRPSVGVEAKIIGMNGHEVKRGETGEILLKSDSNMLSYFGLPDETKRCLVDGWVHTGDAGYMDDEGYIFLKDRIKDMVISGGENIYPVEVENVVAKHLSVADVAIIGIPDEKFGETLLAFVVLESDTQLSIGELREFCVGKIASYKVPRVLEIVNEIPRNPAGKTLKKILRQPYWKDHTRGIA